jgi:predicted enzyme related to lactoylglutathione lyase
MTSLIRQITFDANDPYTLAQFWAGVTGYEIHPDDSPGDDEVGLVAPEGQPVVLFIRVPEPKTAKSRLHFDLTPTTGRDEELDRVLALGATIVEDHRRADGRGWVWCADPEGNAFCVERSLEERAKWDAEHAAAAG